MRLVGLAAYVSARSVVRRAMFISSNLRVGPTTRRGRPFFIACSARGFRVPYSTAGPLAAPHLPPQPKVAIVLGGSLRAEEDDHEDYRRWLDCARPGYRSGGSGKCIRPEHLLGAAGAQPALGEPPRGRLGCRRGAGLFFLLSKPAPS